MAEGAAHPGAKLLGCTKVDVHHVGSTDVEAVWERSDGQTACKQAGELPNYIDIMRTPITVANLLVCACALPLSPVYDAYFLTIQVSQP